MGEPISTVDVKFKELSTESFYPAGEPANTPAATVSAVGTTSDANASQSCVTVADVPVNSGSQLVHATSNDTGEEYDEEKMEALLKKLRREADKLAANQLGIINTWPLTHPVRTVHESTETFLKWINSSNSIFIDKKKALDQKDRDHLERYIKNLVEKLSDSEDESDEENE